MDSRYKDGSSNPLIGRYLIKVVGSGAYRTASYLHVVAQVEPGWYLVEDPDRRFPIKLVALADLNGAEVFEDEAEWDAKIERTEASIEACID